MALAVAPPASTWVETVPRRRTPQADDLVSSLEEYFACADADEARFELWYGRLVEIAVPSDGHQTFVETLFPHYWDWLRRQGLDHRSSKAPYLRGDVAIVVAGSPTVRPDGVTVRAERRGIVRQSVYGVPDAIVEVLSKDRGVYVEHDREDKLELYSRMGVPVYVIVDLEERMAEIYRLRDGAYGKPDSLGDGDSLTFDALPGFSAPLADRFPLVEMETEASGGEMA